MIQSFKNGRTEALFRGEGGDRRWQSFGRVAQRKLLMVDAAHSLLDLTSPANRLEALKGERRVQHSIRINDQVAGVFCLARRTRSRCRDCRSSLRRTALDPRLLIHPGEILKEEFLVPFGLSSNRLAKAIGVPTNRITEIVNGTRGITGEMAVLLGHAFGTTPEFWLNLQSRYELDVANTRSAGRDPPRGCLSSRIANCVTVGWIAGAAPAMVALRFREDFRHRHH